MKSAIIRWINESETVSRMEINFCDVCIMLCIHQCQASILLISHRSGPVPVANKGIICLILKLTDYLVREGTGLHIEKLDERGRRGLLESSHWFLIGFNYNHLKLTIYVMT